jgi:beclin 1
VANLPPPSARVTPESRQTVSQFAGSPDASWQRLNTGNSQKSSLSPGKQPHPTDSFVLLQDSIIRTVPSPTPSPSGGKRKSARARSPSSNQPTSPPEQEETEQPNPSPLSHHLRLTARLFNLLSSRTDIDHPLCAECTQTLLSTLQKQLEETKKERDGYLAYEKEFKREREREIQGLTTEEAEKRIEKVNLEEQQVIEQLKEAEREREQLEEELRLLELDEKALEAEEAE